MEHVFLLHYNTYITKTTERGKLRMRIISAPINKGDVISTTQCCNGVSVGGTTR